MSTAATRHGITDHLLFYHFEHKRKLYRERGLSDHLADRLGLFTACTLARRDAMPPALLIQWAWEMADRHFPREE